MEPEGNSNSQGILPDREKSPQFLPLETGGLCIFFFFLNKTDISLCSLGCPGAHYVDQAGLELTEIHLSLPPECRSKAMHTTPSFYFILNYYRMQCPECGSAWHTCSVSTALFPPLSCFLILLCTFISPCTRGQEWARSPSFSVST